MTTTTDVLETYEFYVQISEEDVRDGDATPWERVVAALAAEVRAQRETIRELQAWGEAMVDDARVGREAREKESRGIA